MNHLRLRRGALLILLMPALMFTCKPEDPTYKPEVDTVINKIQLDTLLEELQFQKDSKIERYAVTNTRRVAIPRRNQPRNITVCVKLGADPDWNIYKSVIVYISRSSGGEVVANFTKGSPESLMFSIPNESGNIQYNLSTEFVKHRGKIIDRGKWIEEGQAGYDVNGRCIPSEGPIVSVTSGSAGATRVTVSIDE